MGLEGSVCVVTGGSRGIGRVAAQTWAKAGATVVILARRKGPLQETASALRAAGGKVHDLVADVSVEADCERVAAFLSDLCGRVDLLFNNAGVVHPVKPVLELEPSEFDRVLSTNLRGVYLMTRALLPLLEARPGSRVLNVTSGLKAAAGYGAYSVSKSALDALTRVMAVELSPRVTVNTFNPGWVRTDMAPDAPTAAETLAPRLLAIAEGRVEAGPGEEL